METCINDDKHGDEQKTSILTKTNFTTIMIVFCLSDSQPDMPVGIIHQYDGILQSTNVVPDAGMCQRISYRFPRR